MHAYKATQCWKINSKRIRHIQYGLRFPKICRSHDTQQLLTPNVDQGISNYFLNFIPEHASSRTKPPKIWIYLLILYQVVLATKSNDWDKFFIISSKQINSLCHTNVKKQYLVWIFGESMDIVSLIVNNVTVWNYPAEKLHE